jgi:hypothetical protein
VVSAGLQPAWAWRVGLITLGTVTYFLAFVPLCLRELRPFLGTAAEIRVRRARQLTLRPDLTGGLLSCTAGAFNPVGPLLILVFGGRGVIWRAFRAGMDVDIALWSTHSE